MTALRALAGGKHIRRVAEQLFARVELPADADKPQLERGILDTYNSHPAMGLTVEMLMSYYRQAERGFPVKQFDMFEDLKERNGHLRGLLDSNVEAVAGCDWVIAPGRDDKPSRIAAEALDDHLRNAVPFRGFIEHHLTSPSHGFACTNTVWDVVDRFVLPIDFLHAPHRRFASPSQERAHELWLVTGTTQRDLLELVPGQWAISRYRDARNPYTAGQLRSGGWWAMMHGWSYRDWFTFAEMFGLPLVLGFYNEHAGEASRLALEEAIRAIGEDGFAVLSDLVEVVIKDTARSGDSSTLYPKLATACEAQMSKVFAGATTAMDTGGDVGSYSLGAVHESRQYKKNLSHARGVETTVRSHICAPFVEWNGFDRAAPPRLRIQITRDSLDRAKSLEIIGQLVPLDSDQIYEEFSLRVPANGKGVKMPSKTPAPGKPPAAP
jgi:phage gp29-like protein